MFKILGSDGKEYGPVTTEQLRQWISEGRAGGQTRVKPDGAADWMLLNTVPEFAEVFHAPPVDADAVGSMPPVVKILAFAMFAVAGISAVWQAVTIFSMIYFTPPGVFKPSPLHYLEWLIGAICLPARIVSGIGLLRSQEWARRLAIGLAFVLTIYGGWGLLQTASWIAKTTDPTFLFRSPQFVLGQLWGIAVFLFNIATIILLTRKPVRGAFAKKTAVAV